MGNFQNATPRTVMILFQPNFFWIFHVRILTKVTYWEFYISNFNLKKKIETFVNMGPYGRENFKTLLLVQLWFFFQPNVFWMFRVTVLIKVTEEIEQKKLEIAISFKSPVIERNGVKFGI